EGIHVHDPLKVDLSATNGAGETANRFGPRSGQADLAEISVGKGLGCGEQVSETSGRVQRLPEILDHSTRQGRCTLNGNLLSQNRARGQLEAVPAAWHSQPRSGCYEFAEH